MQVHFDLPYKTIIIKRYNQTNVKQLWNCIVVMFTMGAAINLGHPIFLKKFIFMIYKIFFSVL